MLEFKTGETRETEHLFWTLQDCLSFLPFLLFWDKYE